MKNHAAVNVSRIFKCEPNRVFAAIAEGMLIRCTDPISDQTDINFKEGGRYQAAWKSGDTVTGKFLEIMPERKVVFSWNKSPKNNANFASTVTVRLEPANGATTLQLTHEGLPTAEAFKNHDRGWEYTLNDLYKQLHGQIEQEREIAGLDLNFSICERIKAPLPEVFEMVRDDSLLEKYFPVKTSASFEQGKTLQWDFENYPTMDLHVHQVIENELIKFQWHDAHVAFAFTTDLDEATVIRLHATGYKPTPKGVHDALDESSGWTDFLARLRQFAEK